VDDYGRLLRWVGFDGLTAEFVPNDLTPPQAEEAIAQEPVEWMYVFDPQGRQVARFRGTPDKVDLSDDLKQRTGALGLYGESVIKDHLIVHNHPPKAEPDPVATFPPSSSDLLMAVDRDLRALIVVSGGVRYDVRRPGQVWPIDEDLMASLLVETGYALDLSEGPFAETLRGRTDRHRHRLLRLHKLGVIDYEEYP
jgi:hypothetical protein